MQAPKARTAPQLPPFVLPGLLALLLTGVLALALGPAWHDPGLFGDDLKWRVGSYTYHPNLEREGRWIAHAWNAAFGPPPSALALQLCLLFWVVAAVLPAEALAGPRRPLSMALAAAAFAANPAALSLLMWPLTSLPAFLLCAATLLAVRLLPQRPSLLALAMAAACALLALTHQLLLLQSVAGAVLVVIGRAWREGGVSPRGLITRLAALIGGAGLGILAGTLFAFLLNAWMFGRFGLAEDPWRLVLLGPERPRGLAALWPAIAYHRGQLDAAIHGLALPLMGVAVLLGLMALRARGAWVGVLAVAGISGVTLVLPVATGIPLPELRGTMLIWQGMAALALLPMVAAAPLQAPIRLGAFAFLSLLPLLALPPATADLARFSADEAHNRREMAAMLQAAAAEAAGRAEPVERLLLLGHPGRFRGLPGRVEYFWWIYFLARAEAVPVFGWPLPARYCPLPDCPDAPVPEGLTPGGPVFPAPGAVVVRDGVAVIRLGP